ncbi:MAG: Na+/H+ antiporter subunit E [Burkholderiaceae bacterium]
MRRVLPFPGVSLALLVTWLLLNQSVAPGDLLLGSLLAIVAPLLARPLQPHDYGRLHRPLLIPKLLIIVLIDVTRSAFNVGQIILFGRTEGLNTQFIRIPLDMHSPHGLAVLSCIINTTPGTVWVEVLPDTHELVLHVFDLQDTQWWIDTIKGRFERPLMEIFEGAPRQGERT